MNTLKLQNPPRTVKARWLALDEPIPEPVVVPLLPPAPPAPSFEDGYEKGYREAQTQAQAELEVEVQKRIQSARGHWDVITQKLNEFPTAVVQQLREQLVTLAFSAVHKVLASTPVSREEVAAQVNQMLDHVEAVTHIEVQLNPQDLALLTTQDQEALWKGELTHLKWTANPSIPRGGCVLHGEFGWMDGRRDTRLNKLEKAALDAVQDLNA